MLFLVGCSVFGGDFRSRAQRGITLEGPGSCLSVNLGFGLRPSLYINIYICMYKGMCIYTYIHTPHSAYSAATAVLVNNQRILDGGWKVYRFMVSDSSAFRG